MFRVYGLQGLQGFENPQPSTLQPGPRLRDNPLLKPGKYPITSLKGHLLGGLGFKSLGLGFAVIGRRCCEGEVSEQARKLREVRRAALARLWRAI